jgi:hypothetical protein
MTTILSHFNEGKFYCEKCKYITNVKKDFNKHILTLKHKNNVNYNQKIPKIPYLFTCECGKNYNHRGSLYNHKKKCNIKNNNNDSEIDNDKKNNISNSKINNDIEINNDSEINNSEINNDNKIYDNSNNSKSLDYKTMFLQIINENKELRKTITELIPKVGNSNNIINSHNKNKFNINVFLNEKCKDALSMDEFVKKIEVSMKNLLTTKEKGQAHGITNIIIENMNKLSLYERPLHCTDKKRETLYVKNNEWEKDENKEYINKALKSIESKQLKNLNIWLEEHPNYMNNPIEQEEFAKLMSECGKSFDVDREKIIKKLCDNVYIEKNE